MLTRLTVIILALTLQGCAGAGMALVATGTGVAAGAGIDHTLGGIAYKTFAAPIQKLRLATLKTLHRLDMKVEKDARRDDDSIHEIVAGATNRIIEIELEPLTRKVTRMRVVANKDVFFFKDAATATEIIIQTAQTLEIQAARRSN